MTSNDKHKQQGSDHYKRALTLTITDESFDADGISKLIATISDEQDNESHNTNDIKNILLETLYDENLSGKHVDFYPSEDEDSSFSRAAITATDDWENDESLIHYTSIQENEANQRLDENSVPGRYQVLTLLGSGTSGQVFAVRDNNLERIIGVKFMHPKNITDVRKIKNFINEACTTAQLEHPNIINVHDIDYTDGAIPYFTMRKAKGHTLQEIIEKPNENIETYSKRASIITRICETISYAHDKGITHNDIKPGNIMLGDFGEICLLDWGTSTNAEQRTDPDHKILGTPMYMSPEQARKELSDEISDVYCIGSTLLHLLTLRLPLYVDDFNDFWDLKKSGFYQSANPLEQKLIPAPLLAISYKAMHQDRKQRYQSVRELRDDLLNFLNGNQVNAYRYNIASLFTRFIARNKKALIASSISLILALVVSSLIYREKLKEHSQWQLIYQQNFDNYDQNDLTHEWRSYEFPNYNINKLQINDLIADPGWIVKDGALQSVTNSTMNIGSRNLTHKTHSPGNLKVSWDIHSIDIARDFNAYIAGENRYHSYTFHIGGFGDPKKVELTKFESVLQVDVGYLDQELKNGQLYHICMEKDNGHVRLSIDDKLIIDYVDPIPLVGPKHETFGFEQNGSVYRIDNIRAYHKPLPEKLSPFTMADDFFSHGQINLALTEYKQLQKTYSQDDYICSVALFRSAQCLLRLKQYKKTKLYLQQFLARYPDHELALNALMNLAHLAILSDDEEQLSAHLTQIGKIYHAKKATRWILSKALDYYEAKLHITHNSQIDRQARQNALSLIQRTLDLEKALGIKAQRFVGYPLNTANHMLANLGYYDDVLRLCPDVYAAAQLQAEIGKPIDAIRTWTQSRKLLQELIAKNEHKLILKYYNDKPHMLKTVFARSTDVENLIAYAEKLSQPTESYKKLLDTADGHIDLIQREWDARIRSGHTEELLEKTAASTSNYISLARNFLYALANKEQYVIDSRTFTVDQKIDAYASYAIRLASEHKIAESIAALDALDSYRNDYHSTIVSGPLLRHLIEWFQHKNKELLYANIQKSITDIQTRYNHKYTLAWGYLVDAVNLETLIEHPYFINKANEITLLRAIHAEINGEYKNAYTLYQQYIFENRATLFLFSTWRSSILKGHSVE